MCIDIGWKERKILDVKSVPSACEGCCSFTPAIFGRVVYQELADQTTASRLRLTSGPEESSMECLSMALLQHVRRIVRSERGTFLNYGRLCLALGSYDRCAVLVA